MDENTPRTTIRLDLVCVPNLVVFGPAVLEKNTTKQKNRCLKNINLYIYIFIYICIYTSSRDRHGVVIAKRNVLCTTNHSR